MTWGDDGFARCSARIVRIALPLDGPSPGGQVGRAASGCRPSRWSNSSPRGSRSGRLLLLDQFAALVQVEGKR